MLKDLTFKIFTSSVDWYAAMFSPNFTLYHMESYINYVIEFVIVLDAPSL